MRNRIKWTDQLSVELEGIVDKLIHDIIAKDDVLAAVVSDCIKDSVEWKTMKLLLKHLFSRKSHIQRILQRLPRDKDKISRWDLYNAVTSYATHDERLKPHVDTMLQNKANLILKKSYDELCDEAIPKLEENN